MDTLCRRSNLTFVRMRILYRPNFCARLIICRQCAAMAMTNKTYADSERGDVPVSAGSRGAGSHGLEPTKLDGAAQDECAPSCLDCAAGDEVSLVLLQCKRHKICDECVRKRATSAEFKRRSVLECLVPHESDVSLSELTPAQRQDNVWIYVDDSNIWIEAKKLVGKQRKFKTREDHRIRIDIGKLTKAVANGRPVIQGFLYGSEPPPIDTVWQKIRERGWKVDPEKKSRIRGKEKKVDTKMVADIVERACNTSINERSTIIIIAGDADVIPAIDKILKNRGWNVEIYMWKQAMASDLKHLRHHAVKVGYLDDHLHKITFTNMRFNPCLLDKYIDTSVVFTMKDRAFIKGVLTKSWCQRLENLAQWPFQYYWLRDHDGETNDLLIVFKSD